MSKPRHARPRSRRFRFIAGLIVGAVVALPLTAMAATGTFSSGSFSLACNASQAGAVTCSGNLPAASTTTTTKPPATTTTTKPPATTTTTVPATTTTVASGGNCTAPIKTMTAGHDTINTDPGNVENWWVDMDEWGGNPPQTMAVCSQSSWNATDNVTATGGNGVQVYPNTEYDINGRNSSSYPSTKAITAYGSITSTFSESNTLGSSSYDAAYDLWTNNWTNETMIWNQWGGTQSYWGQCAEPGPNQNDCVGPGGAIADSAAVMLGGVPYHFLSLGGLGGEQMFFRDTQVTSGSVDILAAYKFEVAQGDAKASDAPTQLEYGVELCGTNGPQNFDLTGLTFSLS